MNVYSEITPEILSLTKLAESTSKIDPALYTKYDVKRGLRDINGKGVLAGLTDIGNVHAYDMVDGKQVPCEGKLYYRGYNIEDLVNGFIRDQRFGFEEVTYLLSIRQNRFLSSATSFSKRAASLSVIQPHRM